MVKVVVLYGGRSVERDVSLVSGRAIAEALRESGHTVHLLDAVDDFVSEVRSINPDLVFNALHGRWGEDGCVQGALELHDILYTHSGVTASAVAMDKVMTKRLVRTVGVVCPDGLTVPLSEARRTRLGRNGIVVKPVNEGSSIDIVILRNDNDHIPNDWDTSAIIMVEEFIDGRELTVTVMGDRVLGVTEIETDRAFYDYDAKYAVGGSVHTVPAHIPGAIADRVQDWSLAAHNVLGCRGVTRSDFMYEVDTGRVAFLEINTQPGMTPTSLVPEQAAHLGISFTDLCNWIAQEALG